MLRMVVVLPVQVSSSAFSLVIWLLGYVWQHLGEFNMKGLAYIVGAVLVVLDLIGIVVGFQSNVGTGLAALFVPPYAIYLGVTDVW
jgi:hypothetical protein